MRASLQDADQTHPRALSVLGVVAGECALSQSGARRLQLHEMHATLVARIESKDPDLTPEERDQQLASLGFRMTRRGLRRIAKEVA
jgi:hypothetical protein